MKIRTATQKIKNVLKTHCKARDSDLSLTYWLVEELGHNPKTMTVHHLLILMHEKKFPHFESISRDRRKVQQEAERDGEWELIGSKRLARLKEQGKVQAELGYNVTP